MSSKNVISSKVERKDLPDVLDKIEDRNECQHAIELLERGHQIKKLLGSERDKKTGKPVKGDPNYGLLAELDDIKEELKMIQISNDMQGIRHMRLGVEAAQQPGKEFLNVTKLMEEGKVTAEQIAAGMDRGESYYKVTFFRLK